MSAKPNSPEASDALPTPACAFGNCILVEEVREMRKTVDRIETALVGNPDLGQRGVIPRLNAVEATVAVHDRRFIKWSAVLGAIGAVLLFIKDAAVAWLAK